jgi:hypothetical protein
MPGVRTIMALVIAVSVAMLPIGRVAASIMMPAGQAVLGEVPEAMAATSQMPDAADDCCADQTKSSPCDQPSGHCPTAFCASSPGSIAYTAAFRFGFPIAAAMLLPIPMDQTVSRRSGSPPFRPPRV